MNGLKDLKLLNKLTCLTLLLYLIGLIAPSSATAQSNPAPADSKQMAVIDAYIATQMQELRIPGLALGIVQGDQIVHLKGFGIADPSGRAVTAQTPFNIGSTTKSFTALAIIQLAEAGRIELNAPVQRYLPWFQVADATASAQITVRHLLHQTSGFSTRTGRRAPDANVDMREDGLEQLVRGLSNVHLSQPVGQGFNTATPTTGHWA
jgi:CubicO group peptidase (beta-lactamase class C family)